MWRVRRVERRGGGSGRACNGEQAEQKGAHGRPFRLEALTLGSIPSARL
jgi:hypothetical protein